MTSGKERSGHATSGASSFAVMPFDPLPMVPETSALLVMNFQTAIVDGNIRDKGTLLPTTAELIQVARKVGMKVIYVVSGFRPGYPEGSPRNQICNAIREFEPFLKSSTGSEVHPVVAPEAGDIIVERRRLSAFVGTDLEVILRSNGIHTLFLAGITTSGVVYATFQHAADADYRVVVVPDCCTDGLAEVHDMLFEELFPRQAAVMPARVVIGILQSP